MNIQSNENNPKNIPSTSNTFKLFVTGLETIGMYLSIASSFLQAK